MSKEKQIEGLIEAIEKCSCVHTDCEQECSQCSNEELYDDTINHIARTVYEAGYRKQINAEWKSGKKHGQYGYYCTNCDAGFTGENAEWIAKEHYFCPRCGAKMNGGE